MSSPSPSSPSPPLASTHPIGTGAPPAALGAGRGLPGRHIGARGGDSLARIQCESQLSHVVVSSLSNLINGYEMWWMDVWCDDSMSDFELEWMCDVMIRSVILNRSLFMWFDLWWLNIPLYNESIYKWISIWRDLCWLNEWISCGGAGVSKMFPVSCDLICDGWISPFIMNRSINGSAYDVIYVGWMNESAAGASASRSMTSDTSAVFFFAKMASLPREHPAAKGRG